MTHSDAYRRMVRYERIGSVLEETEHVSKLVVTLGRASLGLAVFLTAKQEQRRQNREERERETSVNFDEAVIADLIRQNRKTQDLQDAEVVEQSS